MNGKASLTKPDGDRSPTDPDVIAARLLPLHAADQVEALDELEPKLAAGVLDVLPFQTAIGILDYPGLDRPHRLFEHLPRERGARLLESMSADRRTDIFRKLVDPLRSELFDRLAPRIKASLEELLAYPPTSAAGIMTTEFVSMPANWTVEQGLRHIREVGQSKETVYAIYVLDPDTARLLEVISLRRLLLAPPSAEIGSVGEHRKPVTVQPSTDRREVSRLISKYDLLAVPVVTQTGQVLGIVTVDDVIDAMVEETTEQVQRFGGTEALREPYMQIGFLLMIKKRAGWLCALFLSEMLTASAMQSFEGELEKAVVLTLFIPLIMSSGGNSGSQATSLIIRALALHEIRLGDWWRIALRELPAGLTLGAILGLIGIARITLWQFIGFFDYGPHWPLIAATVGATLVGIISFGSLSGSMLPFALQRLGFDPASASAPFVATLVDVTGLVIYFNVAYVILHGTLL